MKFVFISIGSWIAGLVTLLMGAGLVGGFSHLSGATIASMIATALIFSLAYGPSLVWLKGRVETTERASIFLFTSSFALNLPVFLVSLLAIGRTLLAAEAYAVMISFATMGATFGFGFVLSSQRQKRIKEPKSTLRLIVGQQTLSRAS